jgi:hypothetical protein
MVWLGSRRAPFTIDNLSVSGARLIGGIALRKGQQIDIELELETGPVKVTGEVVRVDTPDLMEDQIAVRFLDPAPEARAAIRGVVSRRLANNEAEYNPDAPPDSEERLETTFIGDDPDIEVED